MRRRSVVRRAGAVIVAATVILVATAGPALADPAVPTNYRSQVTNLDPDLEGLAIQVSGGDAFLVVAVAPGHVLEIPGYFGEPYLRVDREGLVWRNLHSPARYINTSRYGTVIPEDANATADPEWERVGDGGRFAWHDHRTHWMSKDLPPAITGDRAQLIFPWEFTMVFDGTPVLVHGELVWFPAENPFGPLLIGLIGLVPLAFWRRGHTSLIAIHLATLACLALFVATVQYAATPIDRAFPSVLIVPASGVMLAITSLALKAWPLRSGAARLLSGMALVIWGLSNLDVLTAPVLPSALPTSVERSLVALVLVSAVALTLLVIVDTVVPSAASRPEPQAADAVR